MLTLKSLDAALTGTQPPLSVVDDSRVCRCGASLPLGVRLGIRSRSRPVLEGRWTCGPRCLERQITAMVLRERQTAPARRAYSHRVPLGLVLLSQGAITHDDLKRAIAVQQDSGERIGDVLKRECGLSERMIAEALAAQWGCGLAMQVALHPDAAARIAPLRLLERTGMLPVRLSHEGRIHVAFAERPDPAAMYALQRIHRVSVVAGIAPVTTWTEGCTRLTEGQPIATEDIECADAAGMEREIVRTIQTTEPVESRFVRVHDLHWLRIWLEPAALAGGPAHCEDVQDIVFRLRPPALS